MKKTINIPISLLLIIAIFMTQLMTWNQQKQWREADVRWQQKVDSTLAERDALDSLYHRHLENCSFIDRENVKVDNRGYLYSYYHKYDGQ